MTPIDQGVDCTRRLKKPRTTIRLERSNIYAQPDELLLLRLLEVPEECPPHCYFWIHVRGGGTLIEDVGKAVWFTAPMENEDCKGAAVIEVFCGSRRIDTAYISISTYATPPHILRWFEENRTYPVRPAEYLKYVATVIKTCTMHIARIVDGKTKYSAAGAITFPTKENYFRLAYSYDCNGIFLQNVQYGRYNAPILKDQWKWLMELEACTTQVIDARSPFLKGERVTLEEGAVIPFGWKPDSRRVAGLHVPGGTIWPPDWRIGDPFPHWECCPIKLLEEGLL